MIPGRAAAFLPPKHLPFPPPTSTAPSHPTCRGGTETSSLPWSPCSAPARRPSLCSRQKGARGSWDPFSGVLAFFLHRAALPQYIRSDYHIIQSRHRRLFFLSHYLMPEQSTRTRKLALENKSHATEHPFNSAHIGEQTQVVSLHSSPNPPTPPSAGQHGLRNRVEGETQRFQTQLPISVVLRSPSLTITFFFWKYTRSGNPTNILHVQIMPTPQQRCSYTQVNTPLTPPRAGVTRPGHSWTVYHT